MSDARSEILGRIRSALKDVPSVETPDDVRVDRGYATVDLEPVGKVARFVERVAEYKAVVHRIVADRLPETVAQICHSRGIRRLALPMDLPKVWVPEGLITLRDGRLTTEELNASDGVMTGCALGIAQTGTIVLDRGEYQGRRVLTLLPDVHLCVIFEDQIVGTVPEAVAKLGNSAGRPDRPMTWISGPSATSDIELNRVEGVHGPRNLEVLVVDRAGSMADEEAVLQNTHRIGRVGDGI